MAIPFFGKKQIDGKLVEVIVEISSTDTGYLAEIHREEGRNSFTMMSPTAEDLQSFLKRVQTEGGISSFSRERM